MIIMKYLIGAICAFIVSIALSFDELKCEHVFTQVEQAAIKIEQPNLFGGSYYKIPHWPSGLQEGKELICVKCYYTQKQVLDYGQPEHGQSLTGLLSGVDTSMFIQGGLLIMDTSNVIRK
jgi:hypothetical protein